MEPKLRSSKDDPLTQEEKQQLLDLMKKINSNSKAKALLVRSLEASQKQDK